MQEYGLVQNQMIKVSFEPKRGGDGGRGWVADGLQEAFIRF